MLKLCRFSLVTRNIYIFNPKHYLFRTFLWLWSFLSQPTSSVECKCYMGEIEYCERLALKSSLSGSVEYWFALPTTGVNFILNLNEFLGSWAHTQKSEQCSAVTVGWWAYCLKNNFFKTYIAMYVLKKLCIVNCEFVSVSTYLSHNK